MISKLYEDTSEAYVGCVKDVLCFPDFVSYPRGMEVRECLDYVFTIKNPSEDPIRTCDNERNETIVRYTELEKRLYDSGTNLASDFAEASKFWKTIQNDDGTINSAYGYLIFKLADQGVAPNFVTPWEWCKQAILKDRDTRQAILRFNRDRHLHAGNKDVVCTMYGNFHARDGKLYLSMHMRSNDLYFGLVYDLPWFCGLLLRMRDELEASGLKLGIGTYTHHSDSMHAYSRNYDSLSKLSGLDLSTGR